MRGRSNGTHSMCPYCGSAEVHVTRWTGLVERCVLYLWEMCPYRCRACYSRFYGRTLVTQRSAEVAARLG